MSYQSQLNDRLDAFVPAGDYVARTLAEKFIAENADLVDGWLQERAVTLLTIHLATRRRIAASAAVRQQFAKASEDAESGDYTTISIFSQHLVVNEQNLSRSIGQMNRQDCLFVSTRHDARAKSHAFEAAFYKAIADQLDDTQTISDIMSEMDYLKMRDSL